jgi:hypothetical protein
MYCVDNSESVAMDSVFQSAPTAEHISAKFVLYVISATGADGWTVVTGTKFTALPLFLFVRLRETIPETTKLLLLIGRTNAKGVKAIVAYLEVVVVLCMWAASRRSSADNRACTTPTSPTFMAEHKHCGQLRPVRLDRQFARCRLPMLRVDPFKSGDCHGEEYLYLVHVYFISYGRYAV